ncbi:hypothetical protein LZ30DRAFT_692530 [Colletotrichum cereale]|nr:hypothetical protein LZ30DRAFT_692530 [Colletotrichum cereale]
MSLVLNMRMSLVVGYTPWDHARGYRRYRTGTSEIGLAALVFCGWIRLVRFASLSAHMGSASHLGAPPDLYGHSWLASSAPASASGCIDVASAGSIVSACMEPLHAAPRRQYEPYNEGLLLRGAEYRPMLQNEKWHRLPLGTQSRSPRIDPTVKTDNVRQRCVCRCATLEAFASFRPILSQCHNFGCIVACPYDNSSRLTRQDSDSGSTRGFMQCNAEPLHEIVHGLASKQSRIAIPPD